MDLKEALGELCRDKVVYTRLDILNKTEKMRLPQFSRGVISSVKQQYFVDIVLARRRERRQK